MAKKKTRTPGKGAASVGEAKTAMSYRLSPARIAAARRVLGTTTATATIEEALDLVVFRNELTTGLGNAFGMKIGKRFPDAKAKGRR